MLTLVYGSGLASISDDAKAQLKIHFAADEVVESDTIADPKDLDGWSRNTVLLVPEDVPNHFLVVRCNRTLSYAEAVSEMS